ncbi:alanine--tRNA ligase [Candidatus Woesearchaeota archaeon]|nr:alanine--tRNA ligase [Candidatus Woesearchaeota archaeon]
MRRKELIKRYIQFFISKGHKEIKNSSLIPENDPTVLFTTAGMHPLVPYLLGQPHALGKRLCNVQRCIRTGDIEEVGDPFHHTFFEMLGNWSLGDYFKKESINFSFEFLTKELKIPKEKISVTCFKGDKDCPKDEESAKIWESLNIKNIKFLPKEDNWWGPAGKTGPCGPDTEIFIDGIEIWNNVFMQYNKNENGNYIPLTQKNVDTGMGVERVISIINNTGDNYLTDCFKPIILLIEKKSEKNYGKNEKDTRTMRIIADHIKAASFIIADGITPGNKEQGYILRRLIRRAVKYSRELGNNFSLSELVEGVYQIYPEYEIISKNKEKIIYEIKEEEEKFLKTLEKGMNLFKKLTENKKEIECKDSFLLYQSYGFPVELIEEECKKRGIIFSKEKFEEECNIHKELSRTATQGKFKSGLADNSEKTTQLHTCSHLLLEALRKVLKDNSIIQKGSNITPDRLRLDFNFDRKLTDEELKEVELLVNTQIEKNLEVTRKEMSLNDAKKEGARGNFEDRYGERVSVYTIGNFSKEICAGPHVKRLGEIKGKFKIIKEESSSAGVRRIKAIIT